MKTILKSCFATSLALVLMYSVSFEAQASEGPLDQELDNYWSVDRDLAVVQDRLYTKEGRFSAGVFVGLLTSEPFYWYLPVGAHLNYFFTDQIGVEVGGSFMDAEGALTNTTEIYDFLEGEVGGFQPELDLEDRMLWRAHALLVWSPLYGKWSFLNNKLTHLDVNLVLGGGAVSVARPNGTRTDSGTEIVPELVFGAGAHFLLSDNWILRTDGRFYVYPGYQSDFQERENSAGFFTSLRIPAEFQLGISYLF